MDFLGRVFEDYVDQLLRRACSSRRLRYVNEETLRKFIQSKKLCDGVIVCGDTVLPVEAKATMYTLDVRTSGDLTQFRGKVSDIFVDAADQIDSTIGFIENGALEPVGIKPRKIHYLLDSA